MWGLFGTAACRPIVPLPPLSSPHSSPEAPRETSASEGGNYTRNFASTSVTHGGTRFFYMRPKLGNGTDSFTSLPKEGMRRIFQMSQKNYNDFGLV